MTKPLVSIIMPVYNCKDFVAAAIDSMLSQTLTDFELLIIDDASTDSTVAIVSGYNDARIKLIIKLINTGLIESLNIGIDLATGTYIARMDGDDISYPERLQKQVTFLNNNPDVALCGTWYKMLSSGVVVEHPQHNEDIKLALLEYCALGHPTVMFRRQFILDNNLKYNEAFEAAEDYELWTRMATKGRIANLPEVLLTYRDHDSQVSKQKKALQYQNTLRCRITMLCNCLGQVNQQDKVYSNIVINNQPAESFLQLKDVLNWLNAVLASNQLLLNYKAFEHYINSKKGNLIAAFYINAPAFHPGMLYDFFRLKTQYQSHLSANQNLRVIAKCLTFWAKSTA
ncbi:glycosyltransferase [Inquilinus sp. KBS0705]|nr:glycosyltransferase [Inquilinus sp. KBS0705]